MFKFQTKMRKKQKIVKKLSVLQKESIRALKLGAGFRDHI